MGNKMSLWRFTEEQLEIGDEYNGYLVIDIQQRVLPSILIHNYHARLQNLPEEPELMQQCIQLLSKKE